MFTSPKRTRPPRIVLAEDDRATACLIEIAMKRTGIRYDLQTVHDGDQAITAIENSSPTAPDLLLLDVHMPGRSGFEVLEYVKRHVRLRRMPVVMFSNSDLATDIAKAYDLHANAYVRKNSDFADLCNTMDTILRFWLQTAMTAFQ